MSTTRRHFLQTGSATTMLAAAAPAQTPKGANDQINIACIGFGIMGQGDVSTVNTVPGAKLVTIDSRWSMIGSANLDIRSFRLNYELNALVLSEERAREVEALFERDFALSRERTPREFARRPGLQKLTEAALRPFAPLL